MKGKVALITGGASGIGRTTAFVFAQKGVTVVVSDIDEEKGKEAVSEIKNQGNEASFFQADISEPTEVKELIDKTIERYWRLDFAFNNAGIEGNQTKIADCEEDLWDRVLNTNLKGVWLCMKYQIPHMLKQGQGVIINNSSVAGKKGFANLSHYVASKHGVIGLTKSAALEYAKDNIRINAICPGIIKTAMINSVTAGNTTAETRFRDMEPIGRIGTPEEVANAVIWLCSDEASFITGIAMNVDGGFLA